MSIQIIESRPHTQVAYPQLELPKKVAQAFYDIGDGQRGLPERAMLNINYFYSGVASPVFEHVGDLTWRLTHWAKQGDIDLEVLIKAEKCYRWVTSAYGFEKEFDENCAVNARHKDMTLDAYMDKLTKLMRAYATEHSKLKAYNKVQWLCREAAVSLGHWQIYNVMKCLRLINEAGRDKKDFILKAYEYELDPNGMPKEYKP